MASRSPLFRPHLIKGSVTSGKRVQKKHTRWLLGRLRPIRCPGCRQPTIQTPAPDQGGLPARKCGSCGLTFTKADARSSK